MQVSVRLEALEAAVAVDAVTAAFWNKAKHPRGKDGRFIELGNIVSGNGITGKVEGTGKGGKIKVRNLADNKVSEVKAKDFKKVSLDHPVGHPVGHHSGPPAAVRDLESTTHGLLHSTQTRLAQPPHAPAKKAAPNAPHRPSAPSAPARPIPAEPAPGKDSEGNDLAVGHRVEVTRGPGKGTTGTVKEVNPDNGRVRFTDHASGQDYYANASLLRSHGPERAPAKKAQPPAPAPVDTTRPSSPNLPGGTRKRTPAPAATPAPAPHPAPEARHPAAVNLPGRRTGDQLSSGDRIRARTQDGSSAHMTVRGVSRRSDGSHTLMAEDEQGNSHRIHLSQDQSVRLSGKAHTPSDAAASHAPSTAAEKEQEAAATGKTVALSDLEDRAKKDGGIVLYHGGLPEGTTLDDIDLNRSGSQQNKRGKSYGGFYLTDAGSKAWSTDYAKSRNGVMHGFKVKKDAKVGDLGTQNIDRLSTEQRNQLAQQYDVVKGKDTLGRDQYVLLNKNAIDGVGETNVGVGREVGADIGTGPARAASGALTAADPSGGPAHRISSDYAPPGGGKKVRRVASKAGAARYGLPIGTPLDGTHSKHKGDKATQASYNTFMAASTPADQRKAASWLSTADLSRAGEALFSFESKNARDESARITLVKELAARGIDPHKLGYKGGPVVLNPNPKPDPTVKAAQKVQKAAAAQARQNAAAQARAQHAASWDAWRKAQTEALKAKQAANQALADERTRLGNQIAQGTITERRAREVYQRVKNG